MSTIPTTMRAAALHGAHDLRVERRAVRWPDAGEVLLRIGAVGICGTDLAEWSYGPQFAPLGVAGPDGQVRDRIVPGHEFAGEVVAVGEGVGAHLIGRTVAASGVHVCGGCRHCLAGRTGNCAAYSVAGLHRDGALCEYLTVPADTVVDADGLSMTEAALIQPTAIALHAVRTSGVRAGESARVIGVGGVGAFIVHILTSMGVHVTASEPDGARMALANELGASAASDRDDAPGVIFEASGSSGGWASAVRAIEPGATIVCVGLHKAPVEIDLAQLTLRQVSIVGSNSFSHPQDFCDARAYVAIRAGRWDGVTTAPIRLERVVTEGLAVMRRGEARAIKTIVDPRIPAAGQRHG